LSPFDEKSISTREWRDQEGIGAMNMKFLEDVPATEIQAKVLILDWIIG
jgi:hypothetical protein